MALSARNLRVPARPTQPPHDRGEARQEPNMRKQFRTHAKSRLRAALAAIDYLGQLSQRARYHYTDEEAMFLMDKLHRKVEETAAAFARGQGNRVEADILFPDEAPALPRPEREEA